MRHAVCCPRYDAYTLLLCRYAARADDDTRVFAAPCRAVRVYATIDYLMSSRHC